MSIIGIIVSTYTTFVKGAFGEDKITMTEKVKEEKKEKQKGGINKTAVLVALILGLSIVGYGYMNISHKNKVFEAEQAEKQEEVLGTEQAEEEEQVQEIEKEIEKERACREANELLVEIKEVCGMRPFPSIDECIKQRIERAEVELKESNLNRANKLKELKSQYIVFRDQCNE